jgi:hypothetical protein
MLPLLLRRAGYEKIRRKAYAIDFSAETDIHQDNVQNLLIVYKLLQPLFVQTQLASQEELQALYEQMEKEIQIEEFGGIDFYFTAWGYKAET